MEGLDIKTIQQFKKLTTEEKLTYVLGECQTKADKLLAMWIAEVSKKIEKEG